MRKESLVNQVKDARETPLAYSFPSISLIVVFSVQHIRSSKYENYQVL